MYSCHTPPPPKNRRRRCLPPRTTTTTVPAVPGHDEHRRGDDEGRHAQVHHHAFPKGVSPLGREELLRASPVDRLDRDAVAVHRKPLGSNSREESARRKPRTRFSCGRLYSTAFPQPTLPCPHHSRNARRCPADRAVLTADPSLVRSVPRVAAACRRAAGSRDRGGGCARRSCGRRRPGRPAPARRWREDRRPRPARR